MVNTNANGCSTMEAIEVNNILAPADQPTITTNAPICAGEDLILQTSSSGVLFEWIGPLGSSQTTLQKPGLTTTVGSTTLSPDNEAYLAGDWSVRVTDVNGCVAEVSLAVPVIIHEIPTAVASNAGEICIGDAAQLFANSYDEAIYEWRIAGNSEIISSMQNPEFANQLQTTVYELIVIVNGCSSPVDSTTVVVREPLQAAPYVSYLLDTDCSVANLQLFANEAINQEVESYAWTGPNGFTSSVPNPTIANASSIHNGVYELTLTDFFGCSMIFSTENIDIIPNVVAEPIISHSGPACAGGEIILSVPVYSGSSVSYNWDINGLNITGQNTNQLIISPVSSSNEGIYRVSVTVDGCTLTSDDYILDVFEMPTLAPNFSLTDNCEGGTLTLFSNADNYNGEIVYEWTGPNGFTSSAPNPVIPNINTEDNGLS